MGSFACQVPHTVQERHLGHAHVRIRRLTHCPLTQRTRRTQHTQRTQRTPRTEETHVGVAEELAEQYATGIEAVLLALRSPRPDDHHARITAIRLAEAALLSLYDSEPAPKRDTVHGLPLAPREAEVLGHVAAGLRNREIAERLGTSENTVKFHVPKILHKPDVRTLAAAAMVFDQRLTCL